MRGIGRIGGVLAVLAVVAVGVAVALNIGKPASSGIPAAEVLGGEEVVATIREAERVELFRLPNERLQDRIEDYSISAGPAELTYQQAESLSAWIVADASYRRVTKTCIPRFGVRARFTRGPSVVDVLFCFDCGILRVYRQGELINAPDGNFDRIAKQLLRLFNERLPDDRD
jgi:hypothetical protein